MNEDDWFADDEGNLRPEVGRALFAGEPLPDANPRVNAIPDLAARLRRVRNTSAAIVVTCIALTLGVQAWRHGAGFRSVPDVAAETTRSARVIGDMVRLRVGPGLRYSASGWLRTGERLRITGNSRGWCAVRLPDGRSGWVFGAYVAGPGQAWLGPQALKRPFRISNQEALPAGWFVLVERASPGGESVVWLPDGRRVSLPSRCLDPVR